MEENKEIHAWPKSKVAGLVIFTVLVTAIVVGWGVYLYTSPDVVKYLPDNSRGKGIVIPSKREPFPSRQIEKNEWLDRFIYEEWPEARSESQIRSVVFDGADVKEHPLICGGEGMFALSNFTRSPDGKQIAFLLPPKSQRDSQPDWKRKIQLGKKVFANGEIYLFDLVENSCRSLGITTDLLYDQTIAFSPDGRYIAYVFYGLHIFDLKASEDKQLTKYEGSAHYPKIISGPLIWNGSSTALYMAVSDSSGSFEKLPTHLEKIDIATGGRKIVVALPDLYPEYYEKGYIGETLFPDRLDVYSVSPDEKHVVFIKNGNLVVREMENGVERIIWRRSDYERYLELHTNRVTKVVWLPSQRIVFTTSQSAPGSGTGSIWEYFDGKAPERLGKGEGLVVDKWGRRIAYEFDYFGDYYIPSNQPIPSGFEPSGHKYNGLAVYDLDTKKETRLSGQGKPTGFVRVWF